MYPDWPRSVEDLVPLPQCEGPKLPAFDFKGPQEIKFLDLLGEGQHSYVFKVDILGCEYALKLFRFVYHEDWQGPSPHTDREDREAMSAFAKYSEPFNAECRAFGRLREENYEELAVPCFGYVLLDEKHERLMMEQFAELEIDFNGNYDNPGAEDVRGRFLGRNGRQPPIRGIVKELARAAEPPLRASFARRILRDVVRLQQLGIIRIDVAFRQLVNSKFADFSTAITIPHFFTSPELNPLITPEWIQSMEMEIFQYSINDFWEFDHMIHDWNLDHGTKLSVFAFPSGRGLRGRDGLRSTPSRERLYTLVDPRGFDWRMRPSSAATASTVSRPGSKRRSQANTTGAVSKPCRRLADRPPRWYYNCEGKMAATFREANVICDTLNWRFRDGRIFPTDGPSFALPKFF